MTTNDQENLERKLNHVLSLGQNIIELYPHITCTERAALLLSMTAAARQLAANMRTVEALLRKNLLDPFRIDYKVYARSIESLRSTWEEELKGAPIFHNLDNQTRPITNPQEIALKEDMDYDLTIRTEDEDEFDFLQSRVGLMANAPVMCEAIDTALAQVSRTLRAIDEDYLRLKGDTQRQDDGLKALEDAYEEAMWDDDKKRLVQDVRIFVALRNSCRDKETFQLYLDRKQWEATDPHDNKHLAELNEWFLAGNRPATFIVENRDKLSLEDIASHFCFVRCRNIVLQQIESFDLEQPAEEAYKDLFVNRATQELAFLLANTISIYVDFRRYYQYAALQMAMMDLGLIYNDRNNGAQMVRYVNTAYLAGQEPIGDTKNITNWTGKLLNKMFGTMDEHHLMGNYTREDFKKLKDYYWLCLSIINKVVQLDLRELQFAPYLYDEHENTPSITDYRNREGKSIMERLSLINSVIKGETLFR